MTSNWTEAIPGILLESSFMTLATADGRGVPWASPVEFVCDEQLQFYWLSVVDTRHSRNVRENPWAAFSIFDCTQVPGVHAVQGLYGEGPVEELSRSEVEMVQSRTRQWIAWRDEDREEPRPETGDRLDAPGSLWRFYRIDPVNFYALDPVALDDGRLEDSRVPVDLTESFTRAYRSRLS